MLEQVVDLYSGPSSFATEDTWRAESRHRWYAVQCKGRREFFAEVNLRRQGFTVFLPRLEKTVRHARQFRAVRTALFPGYLFVALEIERDLWRCINGTLGVVRLVTDGDCPAPVRKGFIEALRNICRPDGLLLRQPDLLVGQEVRVVSGPFGGLIGRLEALPDGGRVRVLLELLGAQVPVLLAHQDVMPEQCCA